MEKCIQPHLTPHKQVNYGWLVALTMEVEGQPFKPLEDNLDHFFTSLEQAKKY